MMRRVILSSILGVILFSTFMAENNQSYALTLSVIDDFDQPPNSFASPGGPFGPQSIFIDNISGPPDNTQREIFLEIFSPATSVTVDYNVNPSTLQAIWPDNSIQLELELEYSQVSPIKLGDVLEFQIQTIDNTSVGATIQLELEQLSLVSCTPITIPAGVGNPPIILPLDEVSCPGISLLDLEQVSNVYFLITTSGGPLAPGGQLILDSLSILALDSSSSVGGTSLPIDTTALLVSGAQSTSMWMIPVILAGIGITVFVLKRK